MKKIKGSRPSHRCEIRANSVFTDVEHSTNSKEMWFFEAYVGSDAV